MSETRYRTLPSRSNRRPKPVPAEPPKSLPVRIHGKVPTRAGVMGSALAAKTREQDLSA